MNLEMEGVSLALGFFHADFVECVCDDLDESHFYKKALKDDQSS